MTHPEPVWFPDDDEPTYSDELFTREDQRVPGLALTTTDGPPPNDEFAWDQTEEVTLELFVDRDITRPR